MPSTPEIDPNLDRPVPKAECAAGSAKRYFLTASFYSGDLKTQGGGKDGFDGADQICMREAEKAGMCGSFKAFVGGIRNGRSLAPADRLADVGPWFNLDGRRVFTDKSAFGRAESSLNVMSNKRSTSSASAWVGFAKAGGANAPSCKGSDGESWTTDAPSAQGHLGCPILGSSWSDSVGSPLGGSGYHTCDVEIPLYCFEQ